MKNTLRAIVAIASILVLPRLDAGPIVIEGKRVVVSSTVDHRPTVERCRDLLENQAFTAGATKECYVVLQPRGDPAYLDMLGKLPELTAHVVCHEGGHQWLRRCDAPNVGQWPFWYREGMAEYLAEECLRADDAKAPQILREDHLARVADALAGGTMLSLPRLLHASAPFSRPHALYAHSDSFYHLLAQDPERVAKLHDGIRRLGGTAGASADYEYARSCAAVVAEVYGPLDALEKRWREVVRKETPRWFEHGRSSQVSGDVAPGAQEGRGRGPRAPRAREVGLVPCEREEGHDPRRARRQGGPHHRGPAGLRSAPWALGGGSP